MRKIVFELCAESIDACLIARDGGADRIELCSALSESGLTPSHGLIREAVTRSRLPIHVLLRPRSGDFVYSDGEFDVMREDLQHIRDLGASGVVLGALRADGSVDIEHTRELVALAGSMEVTFHRAFDSALALDQALEDVIASGCKRILTSGGERDVATGASSLARLVQQAAGRIDIALGGGLNLQNAAEVARTTQAKHFHGSLRRIVESPRRNGLRAVIGEALMPGYVVNIDDIRTMVATLRNA